MPEIYEKSDILTHEFIEAGMVGPGHPMGLGSVFMCIPFFNDIKIRII